MTIDPKIRRAKAAVEKELLTLNNVTGVGVGEKITKGNRTGISSIRVYVKKKVPKTKLPKGQIVPDNINGIPTDVIEMEFELHPAAVALEDIQLHVDTGTYDPLTGGISVGPCRAVNGYIYVGTLGLVVEDNDTDEPMMLSNFHVMCIDNGWSTGDSMAQPGRVDGGSCPGDVVGKLSRAVLGGQVDCAVAKITNRNHNCRITEIGNISGTATAVLEEQVRKRGRTTELTHGFIDDLSLSIPIDYGDGLGTVTLTNQIGIAVDSSQSSKFGDHGDSGSVVVNESNEVIGLYFAGSSDGSFGVANPISAVLGALNVHVCTAGVMPTAAWIDAKNPWTDPATLAWIDHKIPWLDGPVTFKAVDDVKLPANDTLVETIFEGGGTLQESVMPTLQEGIGGINPRDPVTQSPGGSAPFTLATPHHATEASRLEEQQQQGSGYEQHELDRQIEQARQYLQALERRKKNRG